MTPLRRLLPFATTFIALAVADAQVVFTHADSLRGGYPLERSCYDLKYYHLDVRIDPADSSVRGSNTIVFTGVQSSPTIQLDLFANMDLGPVTLEGVREPLQVTRELGAFFVQLPKPIEVGRTYTMRVEYSGKPQVAKMPPWDGGFTWTRDSSGRPWVAVTSQGTGASLWWPNKDHQADEPDSVLLSVTVPSGLQNVSNGRLRATTTLPDGWTRTDWFISSPINSYNLTVNIGTFAHIEDSWMNASGQNLSLDYYVLPENVNRARKQFAEVKDMMACFERSFGPYPFYRDGYKLVEAPHLGMEHQTAVAYGNKYVNGYRGRSTSQVGVKFDFGLVREVILLMKRALKRMDMTAKSFFALAEPGSCFVGSLLELALAADRIYMKDTGEDDVSIATSPMNGGLFPMGNGLSRLQTRFLKEPERVSRALEQGAMTTPDAMKAGLVTFAPDDIDWDDEIRIAFEERAAMSPDAMTGMEANLRFAGPETMETKIFARLSAWQNWIFQRPNAVGERGALTLYGKPERPDFNWNRT